MKASIVIKKSEAEAIRAWIVRCGGIVSTTASQYHLWTARTVHGAVDCYCDKVGTHRLHCHIGSKKIVQSFHAGETKGLAPATKTRQDKNSARKKAEKASIMERDGAVCFYCGTGLWQGEPGAPDQDKPLATIEHFIPLSVGGPDVPSNKLLACQPCNLEAGNQTILEKVKLREANLLRAKIQPA